MNCKPGDLAIVVRDQFSENIGRIVKIVGPAQLTLDAPAWDCDAVGDAPLAIIHHTGGQVYWAHGGEAYDADLRPISGLPLDEETPTEIKEPA